MNDEESNERSCSLNSNEFTKQSVKFDLRIIPGSDAYRTQPLLAWRCFVYRAKEVLKLINWCTLNAICVYSVPSSTSLFYIEYLYSENLISSR